MRWWNRKRQEDELDAELRHHFEALVADKVRAGLSHAEARRQARLEFGGLDHIKDDCRDVRPWTEGAWQDLRFALRTMRRGRGFTIAALASLTLGMGATTAMFSVVNAALLRPLPYRDAGRLVWVTEQIAQFKRSLVLKPRYAAWLQHSTSFERLEAFAYTGGMNLAGGGRTATRVQVGHVTPGFFTMLGVQPRAGRHFTARDDDRIALISYALWREYFNSAPDVTGARLLLNGKERVVAGVLPEDFVPLDAVDTAVWLPDAVQPKDAIPARGMSTVSVIGRLRPGVPMTAAQSDVQVISRRSVSEYPPPWTGYFADSSVRLTSLHDQLTSDGRKAMLLLMGAVAFILLIVCSNVANLFLTRGMNRRREIAIRASIGASRSRLMRLVLLECMLLSAFGGALGLIAAYWGRSGLLFLLPKSLPADVPLDWRVMLFAIGCSLATGLLFGLAPALTMSRVDLAGWLRHKEAHRPRMGLQRALAAGQIALSLVLLIGAGLLIRTFAGMMSIDPGFDPRGVTVGSVSLMPLELYPPERQAAFFERVLESVRAIRGVDTAAVSSTTPLVPFNAVGTGLRGEGEKVINDMVCFTSASAGYFEALRVRLIQGRIYADDETTPVIVVNQSLARALFPGRSDVIGRRVQLIEEGMATIVGVVADIRQLALHENPTPELFRPPKQSPSPWMSVVVRSSLPFERLQPLLTQAVRSVDAEQPLFQVAPLEERLANSLSQRRNRAWLVGLFAAAAMAIAVIGLYGVIAYGVRARSHEIGIRIALGAKSADVFAMFAREGLAVVGAGILAGVIAAVAVARAISSFLYGVSATDPLTFAGVCAVLFATALIATLVPARRATQIDPMTALRDE